MFVSYSKGKRHSQDNQDKEVVHMKYRGNKKSRRGVWLSVVSVVYLQVENSAAGRSLVQRNPTACGVSLCVIQKPQE